MQVISRIVTVLAVVAFLSSSLVVFNTDAQQWPRYYDRRTGVWYEQNPATGRWHAINQWRMRYPTNIHPDDWTSKTEPERYDPAAGGIGY